MRKIISDFHDISSWFMRSIYTLTGSQVPRQSLMYLSISSAPEEIQGIRGLHQSKNNKVEFQCGQDIERFLSVLTHHISSNFFN